MYEQSKLNYLNKIIREKTKYIFVKAKITHKFSNTDSCQWNEQEDYQIGNSCMKDLKILSNFAERGIRRVLYLEYYETTLNGIV